MARYIEKTAAKDTSVIHTAEDDFEAGIRRGIEDYKAGRVVVCRNKNEVVEHIDVAFLRHQHDLRVHLYSGIRLKISIKS